MFILVNLKAYDIDPVAVGEAAVTVADDAGVRVAVAPQPTDIRAVAETGVETWAQHVAPVEPGSHTGSVLADRLRAAGAEGTLINHSERRLRLADIDGAIRAADRVGLETVVCANNPTQSGAVAALGPSAVAVEPPSLIGTGTPVSQADPDIVTDAVDAVQRHGSGVALHCGAGISSGADVAAAGDLGAAGVLVASGVAKAEDPAAALAELVAGA
ncbi:MAG: triose-phosphate isomerase [Halobacteriaceae archaeon]